MSVPDSRRSRLGACPTKEAWILGALAAGRAIHVQAGLERTGQANHFLWGLNGDHRVAWLCPPTGVQASQWHTNPYVPVPTTRQASSRTAMAST